MSKGSSISIMFIANGIAYYPILDMRLILESLVSPSLANVSLAQYFNQI